MKIKNCTVCAKTIKKTYETNADWKRRQFCSVICRYKSPRPEWVKRKISKSCKAHGVGKWMEGRARPLETTLKQRIKIMKLVENGTHNFWKGGISQFTRSVRANYESSIEYRLWRKAVFERDNYTCVSCGIKNGNGKKVVLNADHIKEFALYPELRLAIDNGRTLCRECHYKRHSNVGLPSKASQN